MRPLVDDLVITTGDIDHSKPGSDGLSMTLTVRRSMRFNLRVWLAMKSIQFAAWLVAERFNVIDEAEAIE